jgi:arylsulfatase A-like enzyme
MRRGSRAATSFPFRRVLLFAWNPLLRSNRSLSLAALPGLAFLAGGLLGCAEAALYLIRYPGLRPMVVPQLLVSSAAVGLFLLVGTLIPMAIARLLASRATGRDSVWQFGNALALLLAGAAGVMLLASFRSTIAFRHLPGGDISRLLAQLALVLLSLVVAGWLTPRLVRALRGGGWLARVAVRGKGLLLAALVWTLVAFFGARVQGAPAVGVAAAGEHEPNVVLISIDTLRADHLQVYGYERATSPNIARLAEEGVLFTNAATTWPSSAPGHASMLTGLYPPTHGVMGNGYRLSSVVPTLGEAARAKGLRTGGFINNPWLSYTLGFAQGFDTYFDAERVEVAHEAWPELLLQNVSLYRLLLGLRPGERQPATRLATQWLAHHKDERFFLFLHLLDPHQPYTPDPQFRDRFLRTTGAADPGDTRVFMGKAHKEGGHGMGRNTGERVEMTPEQEAAVVARYDECVANADARIGQLLDALDALGLARNTLVVLTADHGENMTANEPRFHHEGLYESTLRVPLVVRGPGVDRLRAKADAPVSLVDIFPTVADLVGLDLPPVISGVSLAREPLAVLRERELLAIQGTPGPGQSRAVRTERWKFLHSPVVGEILVPLPVRTLGADPDSSVRYPDLADRLAARLDPLYSAAEENAYPSEEGTEELDPKRIEQLKALGYLN